MVEEELAFGSVTELATRIDTGEVSCAALASMLLDRIGRYDEKLHSFITVYEEETRKAAMAADAAIRSGHRVGPFHGMPIAIKDIIEFDGRVTTGGSRVNEQRLSRQTATLVQNLISAGMIIIGKTHTVEFAAGGWGTNQHMGTPWNPWDANVHRAPGGSSSGSAPKGVIFETPRQIKQRAPLIDAVAVASKTMPLGNETRMTDAERALLGNWVRSGAPIDE